MRNSLPIVAHYSSKETALNGCIFCQPDEEGVFLRNEYAYALWDTFPVSNNHALIIPERHARDFFALTKEELVACGELLQEAKKLIEQKDPSVEGFNIGLNVGETAGQTILHCHFHLIPRRVGDVENPRGGVRHVIPGKGFY